MWEALNWERIETVLDCYQGMVDLFLLCYAEMLTEFVALEARARREPIGAPALLEGITRMQAPVVQVHSLAGLVDFILEYAKLPDPDPYRDRMRAIWRMGRDEDPPPQPSAREQLEWIQASM